MLLELEKECMKVYQMKVDEARIERARLHQSLVAKEAELASLMVSLGEQSLHLKVLLSFSTYMLGSLSATEPIMFHLGKDRFIDHQMDSLVES